MAEVRIFTSRSCGWAVRNHASLLEKGVAFEAVPAVDADSNKTAEFLAATPLRRTPVLVHGDTRVFESTLINEYIEDRFPAPPLLPGDPAGRTESRKWTYFCERRLLDALTEIARTGDSRTQEAAAARFNADMEWLNANVLRDGWQGPFLFGELFSLADIAMFSPFQTARAIEKALGGAFRSFQAPVAAWERNISGRASIRQAVEIQEALLF